MRETQLACLNWEALDCVGRTHGFGCSSCFTVPSPRHPPMEYARPTASKGQDMLLVVDLGAFMAAEDKLHDAKYNGV
jgi:hypothetical protein